MSLTACIVTIPEESGRKRAIEWQREYDDLWAALLDGGRRDLRDLDK